MQFESQRQTLRITIAPSVSKTGPRPACRRVRRAALAVVTLAFLLGPAATASAQFSDLTSAFTFQPGVVYSEQRTFQAPSANVLDRLAPTTRKTVSIPIHRTFADAFGQPVGSFPVEVDWSIGPGPAGTLSASAREVEYASGTVRFEAGQEDAEIPVTLLGFPDDRQRQFALNLRPCGCRHWATSPIRGGSGG